MAERLAAAAAALARIHDVAVSAHACDVTDRTAVNAMIATIEGTSAIDIVVNNAGIHQCARFIDYTYEDFKKVLEVNVFSVFHVTQAAFAEAIKNTVPLNFAGVPHGCQ